MKKDPRNIARPQGEAEQIVAANIRTLREAHGMSGRELARRMGLTEISVRKMEYGKRRINLDDFAALLRIFGISADAMLRLLTVRAEVIVE